MRYRKNYLLSYNIDWFCLIGKKWIHCSSQGGLLPNFADDSRLLPQLQALLNIIPTYSDETDVSVNEALIRQRFERHISILQELSAEDQMNVNIEQVYHNFRLNYIDSFVEMAQKGFHSYVRVNIDDITDNSTVLVAKPTDEASLNLYRDISSIIESVNITEFAESSKPLQKYIEGIIKSDAELNFDIDLMSLLNS